MLFLNWIQLFASIKHKKTMLKEAHFYKCQVMVFKAKKAVKAQLQKMHYLFCYSIILTFWNCMNKPYPR